MTLLRTRRLGPLSARAAAIVAMLALTVVALVGGSASASASKRTPPPARRVAALTARRVEVIIQLAPRVSMLAGRNLVRSLGGRPGLDLRIIHGLSAELSARAVAGLARNPLVRAVSPNAPLQETTLVNFPVEKMGTDFNQAVAAPRMWNHSTGAGVGVAVIDTGVTGNLPDFQTSQGSSNSRVVASAVIDPNATTAADTYGHGTLIGGLIAGDGGYIPSSDPLWGKYAGSAPDANLISIKISDDSGNATTLDAIYGLQFAVDHKAAYNIRVVNLSFRSTAAQSYRTDPLDAAVEQAWFDGIVVVAAAGNLGNAPGAVSYAPANDPYVITVGAVDDQGTPTASDDVPTSWSSQGTTQDGFAKPDILAPGAHIVSTLAPGSAFAGLCPTCVMGNNQYFQASGTSLAAPIAAGVVADLLAVHPGWTPSMVKGAIMNTGQPLSAGGSELNAIGAYWASPSQLSSDQGLTPNSLINSATGAIDYSQATWSSGSWSVAGASLTAGWSAESWTCGGCSSGMGGSVNPTSGSWSSGSWSTYWG